MPWEAYAAVMMEREREKIIISLFNSLSVVWDLDDHMDHRDIEGESGTDMSILAVFRHLKSPGNCAVIDQFAACTYQMSCDYIAKVIRLKCKWYGWNTFSHWNPTHKLRLTDLIINAIIYLSVVFMRYLRHIQHRVFFFFWNSIWLKLNLGIGDKWAMETSSSSWKYVRR